ncbi:MAG: hypothetical protein JNM84_21510 [Planctomycetes bacterium]|nr:hypothetical protein [Planctomycetota bacterium]
MLVSTPIAFAVLALAPQAPAPRDGTELETKSYVLPLPTRHRVYANLELLPFSPSHHGSSDEQLEHLIDPGQMIDLLRNVVAPERWEEPGYALRVDESRRLVATASSEVHADLSRALSFLDAHLGRTQDIAVEVYPIAAGSAIPSEVGGVLSAAASQRFVEELRASKAVGAPRAWTVRATPLGFGSAGGSNQHRLVVDLDVEIAQAAAIADPVVDELRIGTETTIRATPIQGGVCLHLLYQHSELLSPIAAKQTGIYRELSNSETGSFERGVLNFELQHPRVGFASLSSKVCIPQGSELLLVHRAKSPWGESGRLLRVRPLTRPEAPRVFALGQRALALRDVSALLPSTDEFGLSDRLMSERSRHSEEGGSLVGFGAPSTDGLIEEVRGALPGEVWDNGLDLQSIGGMLVLVGRPQDLSLVDAAIEKRVADLQSTENLILLLQDRSGQETFAQLALSACSGSRAFFSLGADTLAITDYNVEVAQSSSITDPQVSGVAHALIGTLELARQGEVLWIQLDALLHQLSGDFELTPANAWLDTPIERYSGARARVQENLRLAVGESVRIGDLAPDGKTGFLLTIARR